MVTERNHHHVSFSQLEYELVLKKISKSRTNVAAKILQDTVKATEVTTLRLKLHPWYIHCFTHSHLNH